MKPFIIVGGPCWARTSDPLIMRKRNTPKLKFTHTDKLLIKPNKI